MSLEPINNFSFEQIGQSIAGSTYSRTEGSDPLVEETTWRQKSRLMLSNRKAVCSEAQTAANIYVETIGAGKWGKIKDFFLRKMDRKFARVILQDAQGRNRRVYINVNSLSKRLGTGREAIRKAAEEGDLLDTVKESYRVYQEQEAKVLERYHGIIMDRFITGVNEGLYLRSHEAEVTGITASSLYNVIGIALHYPLEDGQHLIEVRGRKVIVLKQGPGFNITHFNGVQIGKGSFGKVEKAVDIISGTFVAVKTALSFGSKAREDVENEFYMLREIHKYGPVEGIQRAPHLLIHINGNSSLRGYAGRLYQNNLREFNFKALSKLEKLECARQLLSGLEYCHQNLIAVGDIHEGNCLISAIPQEHGVKYDCVLSDFAGARALKEFGQAPRMDDQHLEWGIIKDGIAPLEDMLAFWKWQEAEKNQNTINQLKSILLFRDVYALGLVFYNYIFYDSRIDGTPGYDSVGLLIAKMMAVKIKNRLTAEKALAMLNEIILEEQQKTKMAEFDRKVQALPEQ